MPNYTYTIFDANPNTQSGLAWPSHEDVDIEADTDAEAVAAVRDILSVEAAGLAPADGYDVGQRLYAIVWDANTIIVGEPTYDLTADDLGISDEPEDDADGEPVAVASVEVDDPNDIRGDHEYDRRKDDEIMGR